MPKKILLLKRIDFDNLENYDPICTSVIGVFASEALIQAYLKDQKITPYTGYRERGGSKVYPQWDITELDFYK